MNRILLTVIFMIGSSTWAMGQARGTPSRPPEPRATAPRPPEPRASAPRPPEPRAGDPRTGAPPASGQRPAAAAQGDIRPGVPVNPPPAALLTLKDRQDFVAFMKEHAPNVLRILVNLPPSPARRELFMDFVAQWMEWSSIKNDETLKTIRLTRIGIQDAICRDMIDLAMAANSPPAAKAEKDLRGHVTDLVKNAISEREYRIKKLQDLIRQETDVLNNAGRGISADVARANKLRDLIKQESDALAKEKEGLAADKASQETAVQDRVNAYNQRSRQLGAIMNLVPEDRILMELFFGESVNPPTSGPAGR